MLQLLLTPVLLALALSLDGFGAGITYGIRRMRLPLLSVIIISLCSGLVLCISMQAGTLLQSIISRQAAAVSGAGILILLGCWSLLQQWRGRHESDLDDASRSESVSLSEAALPVTKTGTSGRSEPSSQSLSAEKVFTLEIRKLGLVIQIRKSPSRADLDQSGSISSMEAMWLGIALSLDAFGAGLGAAMMGISPWLTSVISALFCGAFLMLGMKVGFKAASGQRMQLLSLVPAMLLIVMGIMKLL
ncbi:MntP/YtaF family protein [Paenibacillus sp. F411]|uniref:MntP/YtaF family protein n=1 Tax=Paenibacillus sp. F411 TaxID=2820239 RepID=UPI001AAE53C9|nr:MntP/YtaF family protein [Paenibacillus sp. F411]